jgi:serine/threonine protein kinase
MQRERVPTPPPNTLELEDSLLGTRYRVIADLGAGAFGRVVSARDTALQRDVAIKLVPLAAGDRPPAEELLREARVASAAAPAAVVVYDVLSAPVGIGIVMELVPRGSLVPAVRAGTAPERAYDLGRAAVESMATVHASGVMHLDLHPGNLLVRGDRSVAVADFGLARFRRTGGFSRGGHELVWTAPELLEFGVASPQADVFALGLVLRWIERRSGVSFGAVLARACSPDRRSRPADAGELLSGLAARPGNVSAGARA